MKKKLLLLLIMPFLSIAQLTVPAPTDLGLCDNVGGDDGFGVFDLTIKDQEITASQPAGNYSVQYFETLTDAQNGVNVIANVTNYYNIVADFQTLYVRVTDLNNPTQIGFTTLNIRVYSIPVVIAFSAFAVCGENTVFASFYLPAYDAFLIANGDPSNTVSYHATLAHAQLGTNPLPDDFTNTTPNMQTIYARVANAYGCYAISTIVLSVEASPYITDVPDMIVYGESNELFNLSTIQTPLITGGQESVSVSYYMTQADAQAAINPIPDCYVNVVSPQQIWYQIMNNITGCYAIGHFNLIVDSGPNPNPIIDFPDPLFKAKLLSSNDSNDVAKNQCLQSIELDVNGDGEIQTDEALSAIMINVNDSELSSVEGITFFSNVSSLYCNQNLLTELLVGGMLRLSNVDCSKNELTNLDFSQTAVTYLTCHTNDLVSVNLKNGFQHVFPSSNPGNWQFNPDLAFVCADDSEAVQLHELLAFNGYTDVNVSSDCLLSVNENTVAEVTLFPNPANTNVNITSDINIISLTIFDLQGRKILSSSVNALAATVDISSFARGIYCIQLSTIDGLKTMKFICDK